MIFKIKNIKIWLLVLILMISTGIATVMQFVKGKLFEAALVLSTTALTKLITILAVLILGEVLFYYLEWRYENYLTREAIAEQKKAVWRKTLHIRKFDDIEKTIASNLNLITNVVDSLEYNYYFSCFESMYLILRIVFVTVSILSINIYLGVIVFLILFIPLLITRIFREKVSELEKKFMNQQGDNLELYKNIFDNLKSVRILNSREVFFREIKNKIEKERECGQQAKECRLTINSLYSLISYMLHFFTLVFSAILVYKGNISPGMMITLLGLTEQLSMPVISLARNITSINSTESLRNDIEKAMEFDYTEEKALSMSSKITTSNLKVKIGEQYISYKDICFYAGKKYLIEGTSGVGKTVFLETITGLINPKTGTILYDDKTLESDNNPLDDIFLVEAKDCLFKKSSVYNILFRDECSNDELDYMQRFLPKEQLLAEDATKLSTGEKRRILNLRGLMSNRSVLIFDEPVGNIDKENSDIFWEEVINLSKTVIVVSHDSPKWVKEKFDHVLDFKNLVIPEREKE